MFDSESCSSVFLRTDFAPVKHLFDAADGGSAPRLAMTAPSPKRKSDQAVAYAQIQAFSMRRRLSRSNDHLRSSKTAMCHIWHLKNNERFNDLLRQIYKFLTILFAENCLNEGIRDAKCSNHCSSCSFVVRLLSCVERGRLSGRECRVSS